MNPPVNDSRFVDRTGKKYGRLTALRWVGRSASRQSMWECVCVCGNTKIVNGNSLSTGLTRSCGCLLKDSAKKSGLRKRTHGMTGSPEYQAWIGMLSRCYNPKGVEWKYYGGRGITVCSEWAKSFKNFYSHVGNRPSTKHSIDRINVNGNYEPGNVRWATLSEQANNKTNSKKLSHNGETLTIAQWERRLGYSQGVLWHRFKKSPSVEQFFRSLNA